jgi:hypothetical protein
MCYTVPRKSHLLLLLQTRSLLLDNFNEILGSQATTVAFCCPEKMSGYRMQPDLYRNKGANLCLTILNMLLNSGISPAS